MNVASADKAVLDADNRTIDDVSGVSGTVRYVRLYFPKQAGYGSFPHALDVSALVSAR